MAYVMLSILLKKGVGTNCREEFREISADLGKIEAREGSILTRLRSALLSY